MKRLFRFSILEMMVVIAIILIIMSMVMPVLNLVKDKANKAKTTAAAKSIGLTMIAYAEDDLRAFKMPYPIPRTSKQLPWGDKDCLSTHVVQMLFEQKYMKLGDESQLKSSGATSQGYKPMYLKDDIAKKTDKFWKPLTECDFQLYCEKSLTSNASGKFVLVATYDGSTGEFIKSQFNGSGWVIFFADKTTEFVKRGNQRDYDPDAATPELMKDKDEAAITAKTGKPQKDIITAAGGTPVANGGGGSTELMGRKETDIAYKTLVR